MTVVDAPLARPAPMISRLAPAAPAAASLAAVLALWWLATDGLGLVGEDLFASPVAVLERLASFIDEPFAGQTLAGHVLASLERWGLGVGAAVAAGVMLGVAMAVWRDVDAAVSPIFEAVRYIPPLAWVPIAILWFGTSVKAQALVVFVAALPPCVINGYDAIRQLDPVLSKAARTVGAGPLREVVSVAIPTGLPTILAGVSIAVGNGWMALIGAELVGARSGLGFMILRGQENAAPDAILAAMVVIAVIGAAMSALMAVAAGRLVRWRRREGGRNG